jgi:hypothetical protein
MRSVLWQAQNRIRLSREIYKGALHSLPRACEGKDEEAELRCRPFIKMAHLTLLGRHDNNLSEFPFTPTFCCQ